MSGYQYSGVVSERLGSSTVGEDVAGAKVGLTVGDIDGAKVGLTVGDIDVGSDEIGAEVTGDLVGDGQ